MEVIVVADPAAVKAVEGQGLTVKLLDFDEANIGAARNVGLCHAAGEVVGFIDDDSVPEPTWASRLIFPFTHPEVVASTGFVRGRNGFSYQWTAAEVDASGQDHPLDVPEEQVSFHVGSDRRAVKTQGTNCAFRTVDLRAIGGFDPAFRFYLDEADVNLRLAGRGLTAIVPMAQVHHGFAASSRRRGDRVPLSLFEIGASSAVFMRRHDPEQADMVWTRLLGEQRRRLIAHMVSGRIEPRDVGRLLSGLVDGWADGIARQLQPLPKMSDDPPAFLRVPGLGQRLGYAFAGRSWQRAALFAKARTAVAEGHIVTLFLFEPGVRRHWHRFQAEGFWLQTGGLWGRSERDSSLPLAASMSDRVQSEIEKRAKFRPISQ